MTSARILIVDDDPAFLDVYRDLLGEEGYAVETATDRQTTLAKLDAGTWDVVLLDQKLEGRGGPDAGIRLAVEVRSRAPGAKVIIVTAYAEPAAIRRAFDAGVFDYVEKTDVLETLLRARLRNALALAHSQRLAALAADDVEARHLLLAGTDALDAHVVAEHRLRARTLVTVDLHERGRAARVSDISRSSSFSASAHHDGGTRTM